MKVKTLTGSEINLEEDKLQGLKSSLAGSVLVPGDGVRGDSVRNPRIAKGGRCHRQVSNHHEVSGFQLCAWLIRSTSRNP